MPIHLKNYILIHNDYASFWTLQIRQANNIWQLSKPFSINLPPISLISRTGNVTSTFNKISQRNNIIREVIIVSIYQHGNATAIYSRYYDCISSVRQYYPLSVRSSCSFEHLLVISENAKVQWWEYLLK